MTNFILIDYENIRPKNIDSLLGHDCKIMVFLGDTQKKLPLEAVKLLQPFGKDVDYIEMTGQGSNALDFHIAYYLGTLSKDHPHAAFYVLSKDKGFDPLLAHMNKNGINAQRVVQVSAIVPDAKPKKSRTAKPELIKSVAKREVATAKVDVGAFEQHMAKVQDNFPGNNRPKTVTRLKAFVNSRFNKGIEMAEVEKIIDALQDQGFLVIEGAKVSYPGK